MRLLTSTKDDLCAAHQLGSLVPSLPCLLQVTSCVVLFYGGKLIDSGEVKSGDLVSFAFYMQSLFQSFNSMGSIYAGMVQALGAADKVFEVRGAACLASGRRVFLRHTWRAFMACMWRAT